MHQLVTVSLTSKQQEHRNVDGGMKGAVLKLVKMTRSLRVTNKKSWDISISLWLGPGTH